MKVLIWIHGGCFGGGSVNYDKPLREFLSQNGWIVLPVDFALNDFNRAINDIEEHVNNCDGTYKIVLGGVSSGGFLAHIVANRNNLPAILLCPVIKPFDRHTNLPSELQEKQLAFFHTLSNMKKIQDSVTKPNNKRFIIYGSKDDRAPLQAYVNWLMLNNIDNVNNVFLGTVEKSSVLSPRISNVSLTSLIGYDAGHELCNNPPLEMFLEGLSSIFCS